MSFYRRWGGPILAGAVALGMAAGAAWYRVDAEEAYWKAVRAIPPAAAFTVTETAPPETRVETSVSVVERVVTVTPAPPAPQTVVREVPGRPLILTETADPPVTRTTTVTVTPSASRASRAMEAVMAPGEEN